MTHNMNSHKTLVNRILPGIYLDLISRCGETSQPPWLSSLEEASSEMRTSSWLLPLLSGVKPVSLSRPHFRLKCHYGCEEHSSQNPLWTLGDSVQLLGLPRTWGPLSELRGAGNIPVCEGDGKIREERFYKGKVKQTSSYFQALHVR